MNQQEKMSFALDILTLENLTNSYDEFSEQQRRRTEVLLDKMGPFVGESSSIMKEEVLEYLFKKYGV